MYADWADELQVRTRDRVEKLLLDRGSLCAQAGDFEEALEHFRRAAELDEYREGTRLAVIECMTKLGNRRAALAEYDKLKGLLRTELGVEPLPETEESMRRLLDGGGVHEWPDIARPTSVESDDVHTVTASGQAALKVPVRGSPA